MAVREAAAPAKGADATAAWVNGHPDDGVLHAGLDDQLPASESAAVADHVARCASCRTRVAEAHGLIAGARRIVKRVKELSEADPQTSTDILQYATTSSATSQGESAAPAPVTDADTQPVATSAAPSTSAGLPFAARASASSSAGLAGVNRIAKGITAPRWLKLPHIPWNRIGLAASVVVLLASGGLVWNAVRSDAEPTSALTRVSLPVPKVEPARTVAEVPRAETPAAATALADAATPTQPQPTNSQSPRTASINGALDAEPNAGVAAFDSLVLTRRTCAAACDEFVLFVSGTGSIHFVIRSPGGKERADDATAADPALQKMSALISTVLFATSAVPPSGRSVCTVFDDAHVPTFQLIVAHGASRTLHANSCLAPSKALLKLGAQIDSLAASDQLLKSVQSQK